MGFFGGKKEVIGNLTIGFQGADAAHVEFTSTQQDDNSYQYDLVILFCMYYGKILYNLGAGPIAAQLCEDIASHIEVGIATASHEGLKILADGQGLTNESRGVTKIYSAKLLENKGGAKFITTEMTSGEETTYAPLSVKYLLQFVVERLGEGQIQYLFFSIAAMHKYYEEVSVGSLRGMNQGPIYGLDTGLDLFKKFNSQ